MYSFSDWILFLVGSLFTMGAAVIAVTWALNWSYIFWCEQRINRAIAKRKADIVTEEASL